MTGNPLRFLTAALGLALVACASAAPPAREAAMSNLETRQAPEMMPVKEWPLRFKRHKFSVFTYDTYGAKVVYAGQLQISEDDETLQRSSASYGIDYQRSWSGIHGMIDNFPPAAHVTWRSRDGITHEADIDFGTIFADEEVLHNVSREELADLPEGKFSSEPAILLEINDRSIRVFMRAHVPTKELQRPGNRYSDFRNDLILVKSFSF